MDIKLWTY